MGNMKELNLSELLSALLRKAWLIVICAVVAGALAYGYTANFITPMYRSSITIYVNNRVASENTSGFVSQTDLSTSQRLVATYINIIRSDAALTPVAEKVGSGISPAGIRSCMKAYAKGETEIFEVTISHKDPYRAAEIANAIADVAPEEIAKIIEGSSTKIIDRAKPAAAPYTPNKSRNTALGIMAGAVLAALLIVIQTLMDVRVKCEEDLAAISDAPVLGLIPDLAMDSKGQYGYSGYKYCTYKPTSTDSEDRGTEA